MKKFKLMTTIALAGAVALMSTSAFAKGPKKERETGRGAAGFPAIYVTGQDLYYDTILLRDLPYNGTTNFQQLVPLQTGPETEFGPGDTGYYGGRWWVDVNGDGYMDEEDVYFLCPLLGPGREEP